MGRWVSRFFGAFETAAKVVGVIAALLAVVSFLVPPVGELIDIATARRFGATGYVYYKIGDQYAPTDDGTTVFTPFR